jgi:hypothetical protein
MSNEPQNERRRGSAQDEQPAHPCLSCGTMMPRELRFCRACGARLGEGVEEYTETVRFQNMPGTGEARKATAANNPATAANLKGWDTMAPRAPLQSLGGVSSGRGGWKIARTCKRMPRWAIWALIPIIIASMTGSFFSNSTLRNRGRTKASASVNASFIGARYKTADGGAFVETVTPPGSAADKAGLIGGDIITSFDGQPIKSESDLTNLLARTPYGKTVDIAFIRDGETKTTRMTTISEKENDRLEEAFDNRPEGKGFLGIDDIDRVQVPGQNIYGVRIEVVKNRPAYLAGLRGGDIIIEFNGTPIRTPGELSLRIDRAFPQSEAKVVLMRGNDRLEILVKMGEDD